MSISNEPPELLEKNFIQNDHPKYPFPIWVTLFLLTIAIALLWGFGNWYTGKINLIFQESPFLQVTNRDLSLFLWQNPEYMRINAKEKSNYLPGFQYVDKVTVDIAYADQYAVAPPELLFRYHTWKRLISKEFSERAIPVQEFRDFLSYAEEWQPAYWPGATKEYEVLVEKLPSSRHEDLATLSQADLPIEVRMAFQGWKNYFKEGAEIDDLKVTEKQVSNFLFSHPHYKRPYWRNLVMDTVPGYLKSFIGNDENPSDKIFVDKSELTGFVKVAIYNYLHTLEQSQSHSAQ